jgi:RNA polymerase sigma factor (sigma-70 family)
VPGGLLTRAEVVAISTIVGAEEDLHALVQRYAALIRGAVAKVLRRRDDDVADEVLQRVSESLWKQLKREQTIEHPTSYLYRCAVRETVRILQAELDRGAVALEQAADIGSSAAGPDEVLEARELAGATEAIIAELGDDRAAAVRAHLAGFTVDEIMAMHGWPYQKARNLIARGIAELRTRLRQRGVA